MSFRKSYVLSVLTLFLSITVFADANDPVEVVAGDTTILFPVPWPDRAFQDYSDAIYGETDCEGAAETCRVFKWNWADTNEEYSRFQWDTHLVYTSAAVGALSSNSAYGAIGMRFKVPEGNAGSSDYLDANIAGNIYANYDLATGLGISIVARNEVSIHLVGSEPNEPELEDAFNGFLPTAVASQVVVQDECSTSFAVDACTTSNSGNSAFSLDVKLKRGNYYWLVVLSKCTTSTGGGASAICDMGQIDSPFLPRDDPRGIDDTDANRVSLVDASITTDPDLFEILNGLENQLVDVQARLLELETSLDQHDVDVQTKLLGLETRLNLHDADIKADLLKNYQATLEVIRLLHVQQGKRSSEFPACNDGPCTFPAK